MESSDAGVSVFLPVRAGSKRVPRKNTRKFAEFEGGLLELKLRQLQGTKGVDEVILSTDDPDACTIAQSFSDWDSLRVVNRPAHLASDSTNLTELIDYVANIARRSHLLWTHVTSPFMGSDAYMQSLTSYRKNVLEGKYDSLMGVRSIQNYLWSDETNGVINSRGRDERWPPTQSLTSVYEITNSVFIAPRSVYQKRRDRIGGNPYLLTQSEITSLDIDWPDDFAEAERLYKLGVRQ